MLLKENEDAFLGTEIRKNYEKTPENFSARLKPGLKMFQFCMETGATSEVKFENSRVEMPNTQKGKGAIIKSDREDRYLDIGIDSADWNTTHHTVRNNQKSLFFQSLNKKNALRKLRKERKRNPALPEPFWKPSVQAKA